MAPSCSQASFPLGGIAQSPRGRNRGVMNPISLVFWNSGRAQPVVARIAITGDFLPAGTLSLPPGGWTAAARSIAPTFADADVSFANLETPLDTSGLPARPIAGIGQIVAADSASLAYLGQLRCAAVGIANNHTYDFGPAGVERTRSALVARRFVPLGAGRTLCDPPEVFIRKRPCRILGCGPSLARARQASRCRRGTGYTRARPPRIGCDQIARRSIGGRAAPRRLRTHEPPRSERRGSDGLHRPHGLRPRGCLSLSPDQRREIDFNRVGCARFLLLWSRQHRFRLRRFSS